MALHMTNAHLAFSFFVPNDASVGHCVANHTVYYRVARCCARVRAICEFATDIAENRSPCEFPVSVQLNRPRLLTAIQVAVFRFNTFWIVFLSMHWLGTCNF